MVPQDPGMYSSENSRNERMQVLLQARQMLQNNQIMTMVRQQALAHGLNEFSDQDLLRFSPAEFKIATDNPNAINFTNARNNLFVQNEQAIKNNNATYSAIIDSAKTLGRSVFSINDREMLGVALPNYGRTDLFQQSFARLFVEYRDIYVRNELMDNAFRKNKSPDPALTDEQFTATHGAAPWDFVNTALKEGGLDFRIDMPDLFNYGSYQPRLTKTSTGDDVQFANLSSGEKVLMSFAFCLYYATDKRQTAEFPKVLLLDEIDAPLHPAMTRGLIRTIADVLVKQYGISVIMASHSPSTVALHTGDDVCIMQDGRNGLKIARKSAALNLLTEGVPTLSLSYRGRRQVFVESNADAETYPMIYDILKRDIQSERSLEFVSTGIKDASGVDRNTGCTIVTKLVKQLGDAGNTSTFGLVDWDGKHVSTERVVVLAEGHRNGLENVVLDPLIVSAFLCRDCRTEMSKIGIPPATSYFNYVGWTEAQLQPVITQFCQLVLGRTSIETVSVSYIGGIKLLVEKEYLISDDHDI